MNYHRGLIDSAHDSGSTNSSVVGPLASAEAIIGTSSALTSLQGQETIVLVEDEAFVRKATAEALKSVGRAPSQRYGLAANVPTLWIYFLLMSLCREPAATNWLWSSDFCTLESASC